MGNPPKQCNESELWILDWVLSTHMRSQTHQTHTGTLTHHHCENDVTTCTVWLQGNTLNNMHMDIHLQNEQMLALEDHKLGKSAS